jgi:transcriptional regulator with GAF, ATPase, and Fis domain
MAQQTQHTIAVSRGGRVAGLKRRVYTLTVGRGRKAEMRRCVEDSVTLGSHEGNTVVIPSPTVSRFHARLELDPIGYLLTDLDSTNGTFVGGLRVLQAYLQPGTRLLLGDAEVGFDVEREEAQLGLSDADRFGAMIGQSPAMRRLFDELARIAPTDSTVLLQGETGSGKDVAANEIHRHSQRRAGPFVVVDCAGLPEPLIEAELFGHERGAFTGADRTRPGAFEDADGGTLFLDEVAELSPVLQSKLLRVLEARTVKRLGSNDWRKVDVRVIAATHQDLARLCNQRLFREDLYFRLAVLTVRIPPLRERLDDLPLLIHTILEEAGAGTLALDEQLMAAMRGRRWAGNVRELRNVVQRALVLGPKALEEGEGSPDLPEEPFKIAKARAIESFEKDYLMNLLERHKGNVTGAARAAEVDPAWVFRLVKRYAIDVGKLRRGRSGVRDS